MKKEYTVNVHYDMCAVVKVVADSEEEALKAARIEADKVPSEDLDYCGHIGSCISMAKDIEG